MDGESINDLLHRYCGFCLKLTPYTKIREAGSKRVGLAVNWLPSRLGSSWLVIIGIA